jgi:pimeloyl-ACP methyl ester carboxylesterase
MTAMSHKTQFASFPVMVVAILASAWMAPGTEDVLKPGDHDALGKSIAKFMAAKSSEKGVDAARTDVSKELENWKKKIKGRDALSLTSDLGRALWRSFEYEAQTKVKPGKITTVGASYDPAAKASKAQFEYAVWVPSKYSAKQAYPLVLCIPDKGTKPADHLVEKWPLEAIRDNVILVAVPMPGDSLAQWTDMGSEEKPGGAGNLLVTFREIKRIYALDFDRVFLAGRGDGVAAAVTIAARFPDRFAGVIGRTGDVGETPCDNFRNLPTFFAGGGAGATKFAEAIKSAGYDNCTLKPDAQEAEVWAWMQEHPRVSNPTEVVLLPGTPIPTKAYWIEVPPFDGVGKAMIKGKADRSTNTVVVEGEGVTSVILYFNDVIADLDKPVKVVCKGADHLVQVPRNLITTLNLMSSSRSDPGKLYTATMTFDLPVKSKPK